MRLEQLLKNIDVKEIRGALDQEITGIEYDSRKVKPGCLFVAIRGHKQDGHNFIANAIKAGATAIVAEQIDALIPACDRTHTAESRQNQDHFNISAIKVSDPREVLSSLAVNFYKRPFDEMTLTGITGTNGKTTTSYLLEAILFSAGAKPGVMGTVNYRFAGKMIDAPVTTPESLDLMKILREMADAGVTDVVMEVSSHALDQGRVAACPFKVAVFTNLTRDHLDYHGSMEKYFQAKSILFKDSCKHGQTGLIKKRLRTSEQKNRYSAPCDNNIPAAVINIDDARGKELVPLTSFHSVTYGLGKDCDVRADQIQMSQTGLSARLITPQGIVKIKSSLIGDFNLYNILAAAATAFCLELDLATIAEGINRLKSVPGRLEPVKNRLSLPVVVDYAHTPDALSKAMKAVRPLVKGRLITVFGCGGDRDQGKRHEMGLAAGQMSDVVVVTSDNPRTEDPQIIISHIMDGVYKSGLQALPDVGSAKERRRGYLIEINRKNAIRKAVGMAEKTDLILIAGKGHEDYQIIGKQKRPFDDREEVVRAANERF
jgi:UDP-N-acetylmuramoyl-L-alanyl-D-glutamate--2,6-diaminopimelate ligase